MSAAAAANAASQGNIGASREGKPAVALAAKTRTGAVAAAVVEQLHRRVDEIGAGDASEAIERTPVDLADGLLKYVRSNGYVDAAGETAE